MASTGVGIDWKYVLLLFINSGLLFTKSIKSSKRFLVSSDLWNNMKKKAYDPIPIIIKKTVKTKWLLKTLIVVVDQYSSLPHTKLQKVHVSTFVYHQLNHCPGCSMRRAVSAHADIIIQTDHLAA